jgi:glyoxylase-like metal-dependent hydrolase (beta-lactamase superfamily II)
MEVSMEVAPQIHHFDTDPCNWYLITESGRFTVVDAGLPGHYRVFLQGLQSLGGKLSDIEAIILTHAHADHTGFAQRLSEQSGAPIYVHQDDYVMAQRILQLPWFGLLGNAWRSHGRTILWQAIQAGVLQMPRISKAVRFKDGDVLDIPGKPCVLHTPGHSAGQVAFYIPARASLLSGDTLSTRNMLTGQYGQPQLLGASLNANHRQARASLERLKELGTITLLPGHGQPWTGDLHEAIKAALL